MRTIGVDANKSVHSTLAYLFNQLVNLPQTVPNLNLGADFSSSRLGHDCHVILRRTAPVIENQWLPDELPET